MKTLVTEQVKSPRFTAFRKFFIGGVSKDTFEAFLERLKTTCSVGEYVENFVAKHPAFTMRGTKEEIDTIILTPVDFGYERMPTITELFDPARLAKWSKKNAHRLPEGCVVELLPAEAGPHIRHQYKNQPPITCLFVAMEPVTLEVSREPIIFRIGRHKDGERWIYTSPVFPEAKWYPTCSFVFRLRKVTQN